MIGIWTIRGDALSCKLGWGHLADLFVYSNQPPATRVWSITWIEGVHLARHGIVRISLFVTARGYDVGINWGCHVTILHLVSRYVTYHATIFIILSQNVTYNVTVWHQVCRHVIYGEYEIPYVGLLFHTTISPYVTCPVKFAYVDRPILIHVT